MKLLRAALAIAAKDLRIEWRTRTALLTSTVFAALVFLIFVFSRDTGGVSLATLAPSVLWVTLALAVVVALNRAFLLERENSALEGILLAPVSRSAVFWGKWLANLGFVLMIEGIAFPLWILFFGVGLRPALIAVALLALLAAIGFTAVGTVFSAMTVRTRFAELLLPVLLLPFMVPPLFFASQGTIRLFEGRPVTEILSWLKLLALYDLAFLAIATLLFPKVMDE